MQTTTKRILLGLSAGLAAAALALPSYAQDEKAITLTPGLYDISNLVTMSGFTMPSDSAQECIREGENSKTLEQIGEEIGEGQCELSNVVMGDTTGSADYKCAPEGMPFEATGNVEVEHGPEFLKLETHGDLGPMGKVHAIIDMKRIGACPVDAP